MTSHHSIRVAVAAAFAAAALAACERDPATNTVRIDTDGSTVGQKVDRALEKTQQGLDRAGEKIKPALERAGDQVAAAGRSDAAITTSIKADYLKDPDLSVFKIDVDTKEGVVTLNGVTENAAARERAEKLAGAIKGVKEVRNHLTVKAG